ncbi:MAG: glutaredoxin 3 [Rhodospirillales bacterium]|nr:glutaredoxin 3 [Rhodospirillales bacterium]MDE2319421.1 glutaredoxin 3 [Rhodospirillales bacterium]
MPDIEIYTQPYCPYCMRAMAVLERKAASFTEISAPHGTPQREEAIRRSGGRSSVPQIFIGGRHVGGCDDLLVLERAGELDALLTP